MKTLSVSYEAFQTDSARSSSYVLIVFFVRVLYISGSCEEANITIGLKCVRGLNMHGQNESVISKHIHAQLYSFLPLSIEHKEDECGMQMIAKENF